MPHLDTTIAQRTGDLVNSIQKRAWEMVDAPSFFSLVPTMLTEQELCMLSFLANQLEGQGPVLDLGCFVGGSTLALAHGIKNSPSPNRAIHSFDSFELGESTKHRFIYSRGLPFFPGNDGLKLFRLITSSVADIVTTHKGDIADTLPLGSTILTPSPALVFVDICKSPGLTDLVTKRIFPRLDPGAIIVQQDFIYEFAPWATYPFWVLHDEIELVGHCDRYSAVFRVRKAITPAAASEACLGSEGFSKLSVCLEAVKHWFPHAIQQNTLDRAKNLLERYEKADNEWKLITARRRELGNEDRLAPWRQIVGEFSC